MGSLKSSMVAVCSLVGAMTFSTGGNAIEAPGIAPFPSTALIQQVRARYDPYRYGYRHRHYGGYRYRRYYGGGLPPYGANTVITAPRGSAGAAEQENNRRYFCEYAPSRC